MKKYKILAIDKKDAHYGYLTEFEDVIFESEELIHKYGGWVSGALVASEPTNYYGLIVPKGETYYFVSVRVKEITDAN
jgi:hypothetical protein